MEQENPVAKFGENNPVDLSEQDQKDIQKVKGTLGGSSFLPRIQLMATTAKLVGPPTSCKPGNFYLVAGAEEAPVDLGPNFDFVVLAHRSKAFQWNSKGEVRESFDSESELFKEIQRAEAAGESEDKGNDFNSAWGGEFLIWVGDLGVMAHYFFGSKSTRPVAGGIVYPLYKAGTINQTALQHYVQKKFNYWSVKVRACSTPPKMQPTVDQQSEAIELFLNPPKRQEDGETATEESEDR